MSTVFAPRQTRLPRLPRRLRLLASPPDAAASPRAAAVRSAFLLAVAFAALAGLVEVTCLAYARLLEQRLVHVSPQAVWMAPLTYAVLYAVVALPFAARAWRRPDGRWLPWLAGVLACVAAYSPLLLVGGLYPGARLLLSVGIGIRVGTLAAQHRGAVLRLVPRAAAALALVAGGLALGWNGGRWLLERRARAALPAARAGTPNVLLLIWDTVRADELSLYGYPRPTTPTLTRLAARGLTFEDAISTAPWTLPSHAGMFTGRWPHELTADWKRPLDGRFPTLAQVLARHGFVTAGFVANTYYTGLGTGLARGMAHYEDFGFTLGDFLMTTALGRDLVRDHALRERLTGGQIPGRKSAARVEGDFLRWLDGRAAGHPFFAFLNLYDAHSPYLPPAPFDTLFQAAPRRTSLIWRGWRLTRPEARAERNAYDASIAYMDAELGKLVDGLSRRGLLRNTILVVAADHGEEFGAHRVFLHGNSLYFPSLHVPLVIVDPRGPAGVRVPGMVSLRDLPATILDLTGLPGDVFPGRSLATLWRRPGTAPSTPVLAEVRRATGLPGWYPVSAGDLFSVIAGGYHLIVGGKGQEELYDLRADPREQHDLLRPPALARNP